MLGSGKLKLAGKLKTKQEVQDTAELIERLVGDTERLYHKVKDIAAKPDQKAMATFIVTNFLEGLIKDHGSTFKKTPWIFLWKTSVEQDGGNERKSLFDLINDMTEMLEISREYVSENDNFQELRFYAVQRLDGDEDVDIQNVKEYLALPPKQREEYAPAPKVPARNTGSHYLAPASPSDYYLKPTALAAAAKETEETQKEAPVPPPRASLKEIHREKDGEEHKGLEDSRSK